MLHHVNFRRVGFDKRQALPHQSQHAVTVRPGMESRRHRQCLENGICRVRGQRPLGGVYGQQLDASQKNGWRGRRP
jgi:hypothetical protein